jgi:polyisoprenoid-binding protein YceI
MIGTLTRTAVLTLVICLPVSSATTYDLDPGHSQADFTVGHFGVSKIRGALPDVMGTVIFDDSDITKSAVSVRISTATLNSNNEARDKALKSPVFFDVEKYPEIRFESKRVEVSDDGFALVGDLTIRDVTREVSFPFELVGPVEDPFGNSRIGATGHLSLDRRDWGMMLNKVLPGGDLIVENEVVVDIQIEAVTAPDTQSPAQ